MNQFKKDISNKAIRDSDILNKYIFTGEPYIFSDNAGLYAQLKSEISNYFNTEITETLMVGSAKLGFSIARNKLWKPFNDKSDIDMVIISETVFNQFWLDIHDISNFYPDTSTEKDKYSSFLKYFFRGWIRPDFLPIRHPKTQEWLDYFKSISYKNFGPYKINCAIYKSSFFFRKYHEKNIHIIRTGDDNG